MPYPVLLIHTAPWCGACKALMTPDSFSKITEIIRKINPATQIKVVSHENYNKTNKTDEYPPINYIPGFPTLMITTNDNCARRGSMSKCQIFNYKWDGSKLVEIPKKKKDTIRSWLERELKAASLSGANNQSDPVNLGLVVKSKSKSERPKRTFRLVGEND